jgi:hypothetical protein
LKVAHPPERTMTSNRVDDAMRLLDIKTSNHAQAEADRRLRRNMHIVHRGVM